MVTKKSASGSKTGLSLPKKKRPTLKVGSRLASTAAKRTRAEEGESFGAEAVVAKAAAPARSKTARAKKSTSLSAQEERARRTALAIAAAGLDKKALHVEVIDVRGRVDYADYVVVMSGRSDRQVAALARNVEEDLKKKEKQKCLGIEGLPQGSWVLMDFGDVVVHIFHEDVRGYYDLERLWIDAARVPVEE